MFFKLFAQQWIELKRSRNFAKDIFTKTIVFIIAAAFLLMAIAIGFSLNKILESIAPGRDLITVFNGLILYYFMSDFLSRMQLQQLPSLGIQPYLILNISRRKIAEFLTFKTFFSIFNFVPLFIFLPFCFVEILPHAGANAVVGFIISILTLTLFNNFFALFLKQKTNGNGVIPVIGVMVVLLLATLDQYGVFSVSKVSATIFHSVSSHPLYSTVFVFLTAVMFYIYYRNLLRNFYPVELTRKKLKIGSADYSLFERFGSVGELAVLELKLILRNKRSKGTVVRSLIFIFYGLIFYKNDLLQENKFSTMLFAAVLMTGIFQVVYGQFMFAWQSEHFDGLMAAKITPREFFKAKFLLFDITSTVLTILTLLYGLISWKLIVLHVCAYFYTIGFASVATLFLANYNIRRLDLSKSARSNWQAMGAAQWISFLPLVILPLALYMPFALIGNPFSGLILVGGFGFINLLLRRFWIDRLSALFEKRRYTIMEGFRE